MHACFYRVAPFVAAFAIACAGRAPADDAQKTDVENPVVQLVCDAQVRAELKVSAQQRQALDDAYGKIDRRLWQLRDAGAGQFAVEKANLLASMTSDLDAILNHKQLARLRQLEVRARGWPAILAPRVAAELKLTQPQVQSIEKIIEQTRGDLQKAMTSGESAAARQKAQQELRTREGRSIQELLSPEQRQALAGAVGETYDLGQVQPLTFPAPELADVETWLNTEPLSLEQLRGKVVAFHFWAFNCGNCINNLPHYGKWHDLLGSQGLVVLGMHTPETMAERSVDSLRDKVAEHKIRYPVAADRENKNWIAWSNSVWPSVYLVDKRGRVRYWWYGEMNWQGTEGEKFMRGKIEQLLAEDTLATAR
jgi:hypothetical protein